MKSTKTKQDNNLGKILTTAGYSKRVYIDNVLTEISGELADSIYSDMPQEHIKRPPWTKIVELPDFQMLDFEIGQIFGPVIRMDDRYHLLMQIEETYSYDQLGESSFLSAIQLTEPWHGLRRSNDIGLLLSAATRVRRSLDFGRLRLRAVLEAAILVKEVMTENRLSLARATARDLCIDRDVDGLLSLIDLLTSVGSSAVPYSDTHSDIAVRAWRLFQENMAKFEIRGSSDG